VPVASCADDQSGGSTPRLFVAAPQPAVANLKITRLFVGRCVTTLINQVKSPFSTQYSLPDSKVRPDRFEI